VLLLGPSGSGKTAIARVLHDSGPRAARRFVAVDCAQLVADRAQADLFGATKGAYTGLDRDRDGLVAEADGGTLFLDEIGELSPEVQGRLLAFLDQQEYRRMGETRVRNADVRIVAATSRDRGALVEPLLHRLSQWEIRVPSLEQRRSDIPALARAMVARFARRDHVVPPDLSDEAVDALVHRAWPGNVRELENVVTRAVLWAIADGDAVIRRSHLDRSDPPPEAPFVEDEEAATAGFQHRHALEVLARCGGNKTEAAARLGISRDTLYKRLRWNDPGA
jgi:two-component system response regulator HydG